MSQKDCAATLKEVLTCTVEALVDRPQDVEVKITGGGSTHLLILKVAREDIGKVIGRKGRMADSLRIILSAIAMKHNGQKAVLEVDEEHAND
jgi:predicted RNA-binding protein YlqC (UPF0109 family)